MSTDCIEKKILLRAPRSRVWRAISDPEQFGAWFGVKVEGPFTPGTALCGRLVGTQVNEEIAAAQRQYAHMPFEMVVDRVEPEHRFSFRWHPFAVEEGVDYSGEPMTLVTFSLEETPEGVLVTVTESGFDQIPIERRARAFAANEGGWSVVITLLDTYVSQPDQS